MVAFGSDAAFEETNWLEDLPRHAIFSPQTGSQGRQCMTVRNSDLLLANGKSLRMTSLLDIKHSSHDQSSSSSSNNVGIFKELTSDALDFDIAEIILNPTGKLIAVVGSHKIVIVVLPRSGVYSSKSVGIKIPVKAATVGSFYHHERIGGRARLASVKWHPWGHLGSSLLVMSKDGVLREFDVSSDVQEPVQTVSLLPSSPRQANSTLMSSKSRLRSSLYNSRARSQSQTPAAQRSMRSSSRIAFDENDENSEENYIEETPKNRFGSGPAAVTFTFGIDLRNSEEERKGGSLNSVDWKPLTIYTLCTNGDVYALCPFMPKNSSISLAYIYSLSSHLSKQTSNNNTSSSQRYNSDLQSRYLASLLKQARTSREQQIQPSSPPRSRRSFSATPMSLDPRASEPPEENSLGEMNNEVVFLQAPSKAMLPQPPRPQGPFLLWPAPIELSEDRENTSTDLFFAKVESSQASLDVLGILGDDARIDLCLLLEAIEPQWIENSRIANNGKRVASSGRYAISDSDDDDDEPVLESNESANLPSLFVYETIDLGFSSSQPNLPMSTLSPRFVLDPLYSDTVYIQHAKGAHAVGFGKWTKELLEAMSISEEERALSMERVLHQSTPSDVVQVVDSSEPNGVIGLSIVSDIYLSYSFLTLMHSGALVAIELELRVEEEEQNGLAANTIQSAPAIADTSSGLAPYTSLLGDGPVFSIPEPFKTLNGLPFHPRAAIMERHSSSEIQVTSESLRSLATVVSTLRGEMRKIVQGGNIVQSRLELQIKELHRQLSKLNETRKRINEGNQRQAKINTRVNNVLSKQSTLVKKSDWLLQKLVENHSPEVSIYEARWFKELDRLQEEVGKATQTEESDGLKDRVTKLQYQLDLLRPDLNQSRPDSTRETSELMGTKQLQSIEIILAKEAQILAMDRDKISHLQSRMQRNTMY